MNSNSVVFIAFQERENLGIGYMHAILSGAGYKVSTIDVRKDKAEILEELRELDPILVGFSVIFENHICDFQELIAYLRSGGIQSHFTAGGHFATLRPAELFALSPALDSLVRVEGEHSILDLVNHLQIQKGKDWTRVTGISYRDHGTLVNNASRALEPDLDNFPYPFRSDFKEYALEKKYTTLLAGRGCLHNCAFCDIREFYSQAAGPVKRIRKPEKVVEEMAFLHQEHHCRIFLFQDDDFPVLTNRTSVWVEEFCKALKEQKLIGKILWKINCRTDEVEREVFELMKMHGLYKVYLGIEDGTDTGLRRMNKRLLVSDNLEAVQTLKDLAIRIDYGFMLFQPSSTFHSINENLAFLEEICRDGYMPVTFLKMMPYLGTRIEKDLRKEGRLKGQPGFLDYDFPDPAMDNFYAFTDKVFNIWIHAGDGLGNYLKWVINYLAVFTFFHGSFEGIERSSESIRKLVADSNNFIIQTMKELSSLFESGKSGPQMDKALDRVKSSIGKKHQSALKEAAALLEQIEIYYLTRDIFME
ncbi:MAG: radical SAM protein [Bacteroidales bacterium]|nr:radical SAM protein [Bacteroidales bacterium]